MMKNVDILLTLLFLEVLEDDDLEEVVLKTVPKKILPKEKRVVMEPVVIPKERMLIRRADPRGAMTLEIEDFGIKPENILYGEKHGYKATEYVPEAQIVV